MTPGTERALVTSSITANVLSVAGVVASAADKLPASFLPAAAFIFGCTSLYLVHRFLLAGSSAATRRGVLTMTLALVVIVTYWASNLAWPGTFPLGKQPKKADVTVGAKHLTAGAEQEGPPQELKVKEPQQHGRIGTCTAVVGTGKIPEGLQIWVANLNDKDGEADTTGLFNLRQAEQEGVSEWRVSPFGVGTDSDAGKNFWIYVYLLPDSAGSIIENLRRPAKDEGWRPSLNAPIAGLDPIDKIRVQRSGDDTC
ncbi:hypothetical protein OIE43_21895 [Streptomyces pseudovenezuelae]|uniref:hypothetical protein n=1 Tax=Streptomyces pseudovenezuelae TaxID=67350 RepID=UPI002E377A13|nr:hypothetical protein [Streptomyces pseudovenezuelae]